MIIVYGLFSSENEKVRYIGQTRMTALKRLRQHIREALKHEPTNHRMKWIRKTINSGFNIQIIVLKEDATYNEDEKNFIKHYRSSGYKLVNSTDGGDHAFDISPDARKKMSERAKGRKVSDETRAKLSAMRKGTKQSAEWIAKRVENRRKRGKHILSDIAKEKISKSLKGRKIGNESRIRCQVAVQKWWDQRRNIIRPETYYKELEVKLLGQITNSCADAVTA